MEQWNCEKQANGVDWAELERATKVFKGFCKFKGSCNCKPKNQNLVNIPFGELAVIFVQKR